MRKSALPRHLRIEEQITELAIAIREATNENYGWLDEMETYVNDVRCAAWAFVKAYECHHGAGSLVKHVANKMRRANKSLGSNVIAFPGLADD